MYLISTSNTDAGLQYQITYISGGHILEETAFIDRTVEDKTFLWLWWRETTPLYRNGFQTGTASVTIKVDKWRSDATVPWCEACISVQHCIYNMFTSIMHENVKLRFFKTVYFLYMCFWPDCALGSSIAFIHHIHTVSAYNVGNTRRASYHRGSLPHATLCC